MMLDARLLIILEVRTNKSGKQFFVVISQDPHDIAQMSTGRDWTSCMSLVNGINKESTYCEVKSGGLVAYLIHANDTNVENPIARILIRRFSNRRGESIAIQEQSVYGNNVVGFEDAVKKWLTERQQSPRPGPYNLEGGEYSDSFKSNLFVPPTSKKDVINWFRGKIPHAQYKEWRVEVTDLTDDLGDQASYDDWGWGMEFNKTFKSRQEAREYCNGFHKDMYRCHIFPIKHDKSREMQRMATETILNAPRGTYPDEIIDEVAQKITTEAFNSPNLRYNPSLNLLIDTYPEKVPEDMVAGNSPELYYKLIEKEKDPNKKENMIASVLYGVTRKLNKSPLELILNWRTNLNLPDEPEQIKRNMELGIGFISESYLYDVIDREIFGPLFAVMSRNSSDKVARNIPEGITRQLIEFVTKTAVGLPRRFMEPPSRNFDFRQNLAMLLVRLFYKTETDTPSVQNFYESLLPEYEASYHDFNRNNRKKSSLINVQNLGFAIAQLGLNGQKFIPFMRQKLEEAKRDLEKEQGEYASKYNIESIEKEIERYYYILERLETGQTSGKYRFASSSWQYHFIK